ncbi:type II secretion system protein [Chloroflexota bacterium]
MNIAKHRDIIKLMKWASEVVLQFLKGQKGFSLLEALVAVSILGVIGVILVSGLMGASRYSGILEEKHIARALIAECIENIRELEYSDNYSSAISSINMSNQYSVVIYLEETDDDITWYPSDGTKYLQRIEVSIYHGNDLINKMCTFRARRTE